MARKVLIVFILALLCAATVQAQRLQPMIEPHAQAMPLLPFLDYYIDETLGMDIEEIAAMNQEWQAFIPDRLPLVEGMVWLRFRIAPLAADARPRTFLLDMGQSVPGQPILYDPVHNELSGAQEWRENIPAQRNILLLPEARGEAITCFIRLEGVPGPWFAPMIRTPQNAASNWGSLAHMGAVLALGVVMLLCLLRGMSEQGQWRYWVAFFVAVSLAQAILGMPRETQHFSLPDVAATLLPGLALMFLPHAARHLMDARAHSRSIDIQLFLLSLPGAALAILPLIPGWDWLDRWADIWPIGTVLFIPTALGAWIMRLPGSRRFLLASVIPPLFTAFALFGVDFGLPANLLASLPIWAIGLSALLLAATRAPNAAKEAVPPKEVEKKEKNRKKVKKEMPALALEPSEPVINLERPLADPNLRLIPLEHGNEPEAAVEEESILLAPRPVSGARVAWQTEEARELALREPLEDILREVAALKQCALPPSAKEALAGITGAAQKLGNALSSENPVMEEPEQDKREVFDLQKVIRRAHDSVAAVAECSGIALSWYMPPYLNLFYKGNVESLSRTLKLLLESSVRSSSHGAIKLTTRQVPGSKEPGHLLFTVSDDGNGYPPQERSSLALARAWEFTGEYDGYLSVESSSEGTTISFTAHFEPHENDAENGGNEQPVVIISDDKDACHKIAIIAEATPCKTIEIGNEREIIGVQMNSPSVLLIAHGRYAQPAAGDMIKEFFRIGRENGLKKCYALAITPDESSWSLLKASGFTHAMVEPVDPEVLKRTIATLLDLPQPDELFRPDGHSLVEEEPVKDIAPTMLIEQGFAQKDIFEGPHWLAEESTQEDARIVEATRVVASAGQNEIGTDQEHWQGGAGEEWVGEPEPIQGTTSATPDEGKKSNFDVQNFMEGSASLVKSALSGMLSQGASKIEGEPLRASSDPSVLAALDKLDEKMNLAKGLYSSEDSQGIADAIAELADTSENLGLRVVTRMARCVEKAARQKDMTALKDIMPELANAVERTRILILEKQAKRG